MAATAAACVAVVTCGACGWDCDGARLRPGSNGGARLDSIDAAGVAAPEVEDDPEADEPRGRNPGARGLAWLGLLWLGWGLGWG